MVEIFRMTVRFHTTVLVALLGIGASGALSAEESRKHWGDVGEWGVFVDMENNNGCLIEKEFPDGTLVRIGKLPVQHAGYFTALNKAWTHIDTTMEDQYYFDFGDVLFAGEVVGVVEGEWHGGYAFFNNPEFLQDLGVKTQITIEGTRRIPLSVELKGTQRAIAELERCQAAQKS